MHYYNHVESLGEPEHRNMAVELRDNYGMKRQELKRA